MTLSKSNVTIIRDEAECGGDEILVQNLEACIKLPDEDNEAAKVIVVIDEHLGVRTADTNTDGLRTEEVTLSHFLRGIRTATIKRSGNVSWSGSWLTRRT